MKHQMLRLVRERKLTEIIGQPEPLEASGILQRGTVYYVVFDNLPWIGVISEALTFLSWIKEGPQVEGFEDITYSPRTRRFSTIVESALHPINGAESKIYTYNTKFKFQSQEWLNYPLNHSNKGFEGLATIQRNREEYLLALCEGNKCKGGKKGRKPGGGRIKVLKKKDREWHVQDTLKIPNNVRFTDYSSLTVYRDRVGVLSQESSKVWFGQLATDGWKFKDSGVMYSFPRNDKGKKMYGNVEGLSWMGKHQLVVASDKRKRKKQPRRFRHKDQSIHIFEIPDSSFDQ